MQNLFKRIDTALSSAIGAVTILIVFSLTLILGNFTDYYLGPKAASILFFNSAFFGTLLIFIALSLMLSLFKRTPFKKRLTGFYLIHIGLTTLILATIVSALTNISAHIELLPYRDSSIAKTKDLELVVTERATGEVNSIALPNSFLADTINVKLGPITLEEFIPFSTRSFVATPKAAELAAVLETGSGEKVYLSTGSTQTPSFYRSEGVEILLLSPSMLSCIRGADARDCSDIFKGVTVEKVQADLCKPGVFFVVQEGFLNLSNNCLSEEITQKIGELRFIEFSKDIVYNRIYAPTILTKDSKGAVVRIMDKDQRHFVTKKRSVEIENESLFYDVYLKQREIKMPFKLSLSKIYTSSQMGGVAFNDYYADVIVDGKKERIDLNSPLSIKGWSLYLDSVIESQEYPTKLKLMLLYDPVRVFKIIGFGVFCLGLFFLMYERSKNA